MDTGIGAGAARGAHQEADMTPLPQEVLRDPYNLDALFEFAVLGLNVPAPAIGWCFPPRFNCLGCSSSRGPDRGGQSLRKHASREERCRSAAHAFQCEKR